MARKEALAGPPVEDGGTGSGVCLTSNQGFRPNSMTFQSSTMRDGKGGNRRGQGVEEVRGGS